MRVGIGLGISYARSAGSVLDPTTLTIAGYWRASFSGSPWTGTASAGSSGSRNLTEATNPPTTGTAVDGYVPASFDGTNDILSGGLTGGNYWSASAYTTVLLVNPASPSAAAANRYQDEQLISVPSDLLGLSWTSSGVSAWHYGGGADFSGTAFKACSAGSWHMVVARFGSNTLGINVDNGTETTLASKNNVNTFGATAAPVIARSSVASAAFAQAQYLEIMTFQSQLSDATLTQIYGYFKARYPSAGLP